MNGIAKFRQLSIQLVLTLVAAPAFAARFTYHGELMDGDAPATGAYDLRLRSFESPIAESALGEAVELPAIAVRDGRFALELELPDNPRGDTYVEVAIRKSDSGDKFETLGTPQPIAKGNQGCWALDGNTGLPTGSFLGDADPASASPLELRARNAAVARFTPFGTLFSYGDAPSVMLGSPANTANAIGATVSGGGSTLASDGGVCGSCGNHATERFATVSGGNENTALGRASTVGGGEFNRARALYSVVSGGASNGAVGTYAVVPGGAVNCAGGDNSFAAGTYAKIRYGNGPGDATCSGTAASGDGDGDEGTFVWADAQFGEFTSTGPHQFLIRSQGGVGINTAPPVGTIELTVQTDADDLDYSNLWLKQKANADGILFSVGDGAGSNNAGFYLDHYNGSAQARRVELAPNGTVIIRSNVTGADNGVLMSANTGAWASLSDRRLKTAITAVDPTAILERLVAMPMNTWSYTAQGTQVRHIGPMAQDFSAAFGVGESDTTISTVDADGVALAAIQGLNVKLERENSELRQRLAQETAALRTQLDAVLTRLSQLETPD